MLSPNFWEKIREVAIIFCLPIPVISEGLGVSVILVRSEANNECPVETERMKCQVLFSGKNKKI